MTSITAGQSVRLKPQRADAYGVARDSVYTVTEVYNPHPQYKALWAKLEGFGSVKLSELR